MGIPINHTGMTEGWTLLVCVLCLFMVQVRFVPVPLSCLSLLDFWVCPNVEYTLLGIPINYITPKLLFEMGHGWPVTNNQGLSALLLGRSSSLQWFTTGWDWLHHQFHWWSDSCILKFYDCMTISCAFSSQMRLITCPLLWGWIPILLLCQSLPSPCWRWTTTVAVVSPRWSWGLFLGLPIVLPTFYRLLMSIGDGLLLGTRKWSCIATISMRYVIKQRHKHRSLYIGMWVLITIGHDHQSFRDCVTVASHRGCGSWEFHMVQVSQNVEKAREISAGFLLCIWLYNHISYYVYIYIFTHHIYIYIYIQYYDILLYIHLHMYIICFLKELSITSQWIFLVNPPEVM